MTTNSADLILFNAHILTMEYTNPRAGFVATAGERIIGVGDADNWSAFQGNRSRIIDCGGRTVIPGFNDAHIHVFALVSSLLSLDCGPSSVRSIADIQRLVGARANEIPCERWIKGSEYNEFYLAENRHPDRWDLDQAAPNHPIKLAHRTRRACVLNSLALSLANITKETPDPPGGIIERDYETGEPTGLIFGMNTYLSEHVIPPRSVEELEEGTRQANHILLAAGITSFQEATAHNGLSQWHHLQKIKEAGTLCSRVTMMSGFDAFTQFIERGMGPGFGDENLHLGMVKIIIDETRGMMDPPQELLNEMVLAVQRAGFQAAIHAIEVTTVEAAVTAIEYALHRVSEGDYRHRIEHCSECPPELLRRMREAGITIVTQPAFLYHGGERYLSQVAPEKLPWLYRLGAFQRNGITVAASSDGPVTPINPLESIYAAVTRRAKNGHTLLPEERISPWEALWMHTMGGAYASFKDDVKGSIATGKLADLVVLDNDPTEVMSREIKDITVEKTIIGGEIVWERE